jgi:small subunit ribosomal protein S17
MSRKKLKGTIKRVSGKNTIAVEVVRVYHHPRYRKRILTSKVYLAHVEGADAVVGMGAIIEESRPISKRKRWLVVELNGKPVGKVEEPIPAVEKPVKKVSKKGSRRKKK